jgi:pectate lyase
MEPQAAIHTGQAILVKDAANIHFTNCTIAHTGNYGLYIADRCHHIKVDHNNFFDLGAGGIKVGLPVKDVIATATPFSDLPYEITISDNIIHNGGLTLPGCVGIWIGQCHRNQVIHNELYNLPYSGISMGWTWANVTTYTKDNLLANNNIHNVLQTLTDGGGIYTLGKLNGSQIKGNYIHDIVRHARAAGGGSQGIFFDESSQDVSVEGNVITGVKGSIAFNGTKKENMTWGENFFDDGGDKEAMNAIKRKAGPRR